MGDKRKICATAANTSRNRYDQKTEVREVSAVLAQKGFENGQTKKSRHVQEQGCGEETRTRRSVFQAPLDWGLGMPSVAGSVITDIFKAEPLFAGLINPGLPETILRREDSRSVPSSIRVLDHCLCSDSTCDDSAPRTAITTAATDYDQRAIAVGCTGDSVAFSDSRPNTILRIRKSRGQGSALGNLGDHV